mgnify:FL=1
MVRIKTQLAARQNYGGRRTQKIDWIVMHYTANDGDCDEANGRYFQQVLDPVASAHYFVDDDSITRSVPDEFVAYHCGAQAYRHPSCRNSNSIGVELCDSRRDGQVMATERTLENAAELVHWLCRQYDVPYSHILRHYDVTGKLCPAYWVGNDGLERFRKRVEEADEVVEQSKMIVDGKTVPVARILKNGTNYVKIRDVAAALGLEVGFTGNIAVLRSPKKE